VVSASPLFDSAAETYDDDPHHGVLAELLLAGLPHTAQPPDLLVDVATGTGVAAFAALRTLDPSHVLAVDISPCMVERAIAKAAAADPDGRIDWQVAPAVPLAVPDGAADLVLCTSSLHFLGMAALQDWRRALRPGGLVAFSIPMAADFRPSPAFRDLLPTDLTIPADAAAAERLALDAGFVDVHVTISPPSAPDRPRRAFLVHAQVA
jgi:ubiquinone/menaquinone biosynthesis C-methylase UbiE